LDLTASINWLVVSTILKNMSSSMGRMTSHILWKNKSHVPKHQLERHQISSRLWNLSIQPAKEWLNIRKSHQEPPFSGGLRWMFDSVQKNDLWLRSESLLAPFPISGK
jgi:hypothetical protein